MDEKILFFFNTHLAALPLYEAFESRVMAEIPDAAVRAQKTQLTFTNRHVFACASFRRVRRNLPEPYLVITFGLDHRVDSPRIAVAVEPYPRRWTHHVVIASPEEVDGELMAWVREAAEFSASKR